MTDARHVVSTTIDHSFLRSEKKMTESKSKNTIISQQSVVTVGVLVLAIGATAFIVAGATNANAKIDLLTGSVNSGFVRMDTRLSKIEATVDVQARDMQTQAHDISLYQRDTISRLSVLEDQMKRVQSTQSK